METFQRGLGSETVQSGKDCGGAKGENRIVSKSHQGLRHKVRAQELWTSHLMVIPSTQTQGLEL